MGSEMCIRDRHKTLQENVQSSLRLRVNQRINHIFYLLWVYLKNINKDLNEETIHELANTVLTYSDLLTNRKTDYKFNLNKFFLRKKENKEVDLESTRGEVRSLGMKAGLSYYDRVMLDNVIGFSSIEVEEAMVPRADIVAIPEKSSLNELTTVFGNLPEKKKPLTNNFVNISAPHDYRWLGDYN